MDSDAEFYVVWNPNGGNPTMRHGALSSAINEAERLARQCGGQKFYVLKAVTVSTKNDVRTERLFEEAPF